MDSSADADLTTSPQAQQQQQKRSNDVLPKPVNLTCYRQLPEFWVVPPVNPVPPRFLGILWGIVRLTRLQAVQRTELGILGGQNAPFGQSVRAVLLEDTAAVEVAVVIKVVVY